MAAVVVTSAWVVSVRFATFLLMTSTFRCFAASQHRATPNSEKSIVIIHRQVVRVQFWWRNLSDIRNPTSPNAQAIKVQTGGSLP